MANLLSLVRSLLWFERGELGEILGKLRHTKFGYEARWEAESLAPLAVGLLLAFSANIWLGALYLWLSKTALQAMNRKRLFDPLP